MTTIELAPPGLASEVEVGRPHPLGAHFDGEGTNFSLFAQDATGVELLLFDPERPDHLTGTVELDPRSHRSFHFWHAYVPAAGPGTPYGFRVRGPRQPEPRHGFDPEKVLIDPYARAVWDGAFDRAAACRPGGNLNNSLRGIVVGTDYAWEGDQPLRRPLRDTVIYEMHVGGFTGGAEAGVRHPGTFAAVIEKIPYLLELGVTAVELLPVFAFDHQSPLRTHPDDGRPLRNFWGYDPYAHFAPHPGYAVPGGRPKAVVDEFRDMVKALHRAGLEVILDVVFNHTSEGDDRGPVLSLKGLAKDVYYLAAPDSPDWRHANYSGCGNTLNANHPITAQLIADCLEYWVHEMHVDGFRFDEASALFRGEDGAPLRYPPSVWRIEMAESLAGIKLIAEAWDAGGLYQVGQFPDRWSQWNGPFRDDVRRFVRGEPGRLAELASRVCGSADIFQAAAERPTNAVNFVTAHDGFTLRDLVSYDSKHNEANGEENRDGNADNLSWNCGVEGPTDDPAVRELRMRQMKNFACHLLLAQGVPMIVAGDERGRTQHGNNNVYCQDNELGWVDWRDDDESAELARFFRQLIKLRRQHPALGRREYVDDPADPQPSPYTWHGCELEQPGWSDPLGRALALTVRSAGHTAADALREGHDDDAGDLHLIFNAHWEELTFQLPPRPGQRWVRIIDTARPAPGDITLDPDAPAEGGAIVAAARSTVVLLARDDERPAAREAGRDAGGTDRPREDTP